MNASQMAGELLAAEGEEVCGDDPSRENLSLIWKSEMFNDQGIVAIYTLLFILGVPLNCYILAVVIYKKLYHQPTFLLLCNLAITDLFLCLGPLFFNIITLLNRQGSLGNNDFVKCHVCKIGATFLIFTNSTTFTLMLLSIDRLIFFRTPLKYDKIVTMRRVFGACVVEWIVSFAITIPTLAGYGDFVYSLVCGLVFVTPFHIRRGIVFLAVTGPISVGATIVLMVCNVWMVILAVRVYRRVRKIGHAPVAPASDCKEKESAGSLSRNLSTRLKWKSLRGMEIARKQCAFLQTFGAIIVVDFISLILIGVVGVLFSLNTEIPIGFVKFVVVVIYSQTITHPILQVLLTPELRKLLLQYRALKKCEHRMTCTICDYCRGDFLIRDVASKLNKMQPTLNSSHIDTNT